MDAMVKVVVYGLRNAGESQGKMLRRQSDVAQVTHEIRRVSQKVGEMKVCRDVVLWLKGKLRCRQPPFGVRREIIELEIR